MVRFVMDHVDIDIRWIRRKVMMTFTYLRIRPVSNIFLPGKLKFGLANSALKRRVLRVLIHLSLLPLVSRRHALPVKAF
ncbi:MAG: hypothetical protein ACD_10C00303G0005 [uncultured bacterium]|nr:MAG: hypothetical protein ACD_10C00303G0005 [uncultured bacterium]